MSGQPNGTNGTNGSQQPNGGQVTQQSAPQQRPQQGPFLVDIQRQREGGSGQMSSGAIRLAAGQTTAGRDRITQSDNLPNGTGLNGANGTQ